MRTFSDRRTDGASPKNLMVGSMIFFLEKSQNSEIFWYAVAFQGCRHEKYHSDLGGANDQKFWVFPVSVLVLVK